MTSAQPAIEHAHANRETYMAGYLELLRIPSVSTDPAFKAELERCADWVRDEMERIGFKNCRQNAHRRTSGALWRMAGSRRG